MRSGSSRCASATDSRAGHRRRPSAWCSASELMPWVQHVRHAVPVIDRGYQEGLDSGDILWAGYLVMYRVLLDAFSGKRLDEVLDGIPDQLGFTSRTQNPGAAAGILAHQIVLSTLAGRTKSSAEFAGGGVDEATFLQSCERTPYRDGDMPLQDPQGAGALPVRPAEAGPRRHPRNRGHARLHRQPSQPCRPSALPVPVPGGALEWKRERRGARRAGAASSQPRPAQSLVGQLPGQLPREAPDGRGRNRAYHGQRRRRRRPLRSRHRCRARRTVCARRGAGQRIGGAVRDGASPLVPGWRDVPARCPLRVPALGGEPEGRRARDGVSAAAHGIPGCARGRRRSLADHRDPPPNHHAIGRGEPRPEHPPEGGADHLR